MTAVEITNVLILVTDILKRNEAKVSKLLKVEQVAKGQLGQGKSDFDIMVANILNEHKDEIKKNVEQQSKLISNRLQQRQQVFPLRKIK